MEEAFKDGFPDPPPQNLLEIAMEQNPSGEFEEDYQVIKQNPPDDEENMTVDVLTQLVDEIIRLNLKNDEMLELLMVGPEQEVEVQGINVNQKKIKKKKEVRRRNLKKKEKV